MVEVLEQFGAVRDRQARAKGRLIAGLRHDNELLVAEMVARGSSTTPPAEAAALCSALIEEARSGDPAVARAVPPEAAQAQAQARAARWRASPTPCTRRSARATCACRSACPAGFMPAVFRWASGEDDWSGIVEESFGGHEGDLIRAMRRLIDLLRQLADSPEVPPATARCWPTSPG